MRILIEWKNTEGKVMAPNCTKIHGNLIKKLCDEVAGSLSACGMLVIPQCWEYFQAASKEHRLGNIYFCRVLWQPNSRSTSLLPEGTRLFWENRNIFFKQPCYKAYVSDVAVFQKVKLISHLHSAVTLFLNLWDIRNVLRLRKFSHLRSDYRWV